MANMSTKHPFHLVDPSPWPMFASFSALFMVCGGVMYMHSYEHGGLVLSMGFAMVLYGCMVA